MTRRRVIDNREADARRVQSKMRSGHGGQAKLTRARMLRQITIRFL